IQANVYTLGVFQLTSGMGDFSGYVGQPLYVGRSGQIVTSSGSFNSGGLLSGDVSQPLGTALNSGAAVVAAAATLPFVAGLVTSGQVASGQIGTVHLASGTKAYRSETVSNDDFLTAETISGVRCVSVNSSGQLQIA